MKLKNIFCITVLSTMATTLVASAQSLDFTVFESSGANAADLDEISLSAHLFDTVDGVEIQIANNSTPGDAWVTTDMPTITSLFFEDGDGLLIAPSFNAAGSIGTVDYEYASGGNLPGGESIAFESVFSFKASPSPVNNGIDPNEVGSFTFTGSDYAAVLAALNSGEVRIGAHVQQIGADGSGSVSYVIPEPGTSMLALFGALALFRRKR